MPLITCNECNNEISDKSSSCIHCGNPISTSQLIEVSFSFLKFAIIFIVAMIPTYLLRGAFVLGSMQDLNNHGAIESQGSVMNWLMVICYAVMILITYRRAKAIGKSYTVVFPVLAAIFDLILIFIPFVPTVLNIITIILLKPSSDKEVLKTNR